MRSGAFLAALLLAATSCRRPERVLRVGMRSEADRAHLVRGWSGFEVSGGPKPVPFCWVDGISSKVNAGRPPRSGTARFRLRAWPFTPPSQPAQDVQLWVNSMFIGTRTMDEGTRDYEWTFPAALFQRESNDLYLLFRRASRPRDVVPGNGDTRELAAAVERLELSVER